MQIPSVSDLFQSRLGAAGIGRAAAGFAQEYASALTQASAESNGNFFEMNIQPSAATAQTQAQPLGWTPPQTLATAAQAGRAYAAAPMYIPAAQAAAAAPASGSRASELVAWARQFVGTPYVRGGEDLEKGVDCSGFTQSVFKHFGVKLPRSAYRQSMVGKPVAPDALQPGDLMFFKTDDYAPVTHVAIYVGDGKILHASGVKTGVIISRLRKNWQNGDFVCAKRML